MKDKIYLVKVRGIYDFCVEIDTEYCFKNRENAKAKFDELCEEAKEERKNYDTCDEGEDYFELYDEGWSGRDCYSIFLREVEIED